MTRTMMLASLLLASTAVTGCDNKSAETTSETAMDSSGDSMDEGSPVAEAAPTESSDDGDDRGGNDINR